MLISQVYEQFRSDADDEVELNRYHNDLKVYRYIDRAIKFINDHLRVARKEAYLKLEGYKNVYSLPADFMECVRVWNVKENQYLKNTVLGNEHQKSVGTVKRFETDERPAHRKIIFKEIPDGAYHGIQYRITAYSDSPEYIEVYTESIYAENWWQPSIVIAYDSSGNKETIQVTVCEEKEEKPFKSLEGITVNSVNGSEIEITGGDISAYLQSGDLVTFGSEDTEYTVVSVTDSAHFTVNASPTLTGGETVNKRVTVWRYYVSERSVTGTASLALNDTITESDGFYLYHASLIMDYIYEPRDIWAEGAGTISVDASHQVDTADDMSDLSEGDYLYYSGRAYRIEDTATMTLEDSAPAVTDVSYYKIYASREPELPLNIQQYISQTALCYALENESRRDESTTQLAKMIELFEEIRFKEFREAVKKKNNTDAQNRNHLIGDGYWQNDVEEEIWNS